MRTWVGLMGLALGFVACGGSGGADAPLSGDVEGCEVGGPCNPDALDSDTGSDAATGETIANEWGLPVRVPRLHSLEFELPWGETQTVEVLDADWLCTFVHAGVTAMVYSRAMPVGMGQSMSGYPICTSEGAWMSRDGSVSTLANPAYDWGGNHHNDALEFDLDGHRYQYFHSSIGAGFRSCHTMDCLKVFDADGAALVEDGCTAERTLPIVCVQVREDGTWEPLVDTFQPCAQ